MKLLATKLITAGFVVVCLLVFIICTYFIWYVRVPFDEDEYYRLTDYYKNYDGILLESNHIADIKKAIRKNRRNDYMYFKVNDEYDLFIEKTLKARQMWVPRAYVRTQKPVQNEFEDKYKFIKAVCHYYASEWVRNHPDKRYFYCPGAGPVKKNEKWAIETGKSVIAGPGLLITVDDDGNLIDIKEIFNPE